MIKHLVPAIMLTVLMTLLTGLAYPLAMTGLAGRLFPYQANGSIVYVNGKPVGSAIIGQLWTKPQYFHGRPSAAGKNGYDPTATGGTNYGPTNKKLIAKMPRMYAAPFANASEGKTPYRAFDGPGTPMETGKKVQFTAISDGTSNTILIVEGEPTIWTKPDDVFIKDKEMPKDLKKRFGGQFKGMFIVGLWDGSVRSISPSMSDETLWNALRPDDGEVLGSDW